LEAAQQRGVASAPLLVGVVGIPGSGTVCRNLAFNFDFTILCLQTGYLHSSDRFYETTFFKSLAGKSTSCEILADILPNAMVMPMDGYHYSLDELHNMENPEDMVYRRGAPDTFDPHSLKKDLNRILDGDEPTVSIPGFDHAVGDPQPDQHTFIRGQHEIVICEGIYLLHDSDGWEDVKTYLDYSIFIQVGIDVCIDRLKERNKCIPGYTHEEIEVRCEVVDRRNAEVSQHSQQHADLVVKSGAVGMEDVCVL
jgi:pantothenate kinase